MSKNWTYEPSGDVDGDRVGTDHFVMEGDEEIGRFRDERTARLVASAPDLLDACRAVLADSDLGTDTKLDGDPDEPVYDGDGAEWFTAGLVNQLQAAVAKATGPKP